MQEKCGNLIVASCLLDYTGSRGVGCISIQQYINTIFKYHDTIPYCKDIDTTHVILILNHVHYEVDTDGSKNNGAGKEVEVKNLDSTVSGTS